MSAKSSKTSVTVVPDGGFTVEAELSVGESSSRDLDDTATWAVWPEDYYPGEYIEGYVSGELGEGLFSEIVEEELQWGEGGETFYVGEQQEAMEEDLKEEEDSDRRSASFGDSRVKATFRSKQFVSMEPRRRSLFVHSSPSQFPDVNRARKSAFGSIFVRTIARVAEDTALLKSVADCSYSMLQSLLDSFERIISMATSDADRRHMILAFKESLLRALEVHGIGRTYSDGSVQWNIYPITQDYLFSFQIGDRLHQTKLLSRVEDRILTGPVQKLQLPYAWPTDSVWTGYWDMLGMAGLGTYNMPHGVSYNGKMQDGMFHDGDAMLTYPNQFKALHCVYEKGKLQDCQFQFPDWLMHKKEDWEYCKFPDRRFWSEVRRGLKPAKIAQKTELDPCRFIPPGCYDTSDGFFDPVSLMLLSPSGELLRVPVCEEISWIKKYCRKGFRAQSDFRPDLYENWFNNDQDLIQSILKQQANFQDGKITYEELQQFYEEMHLLPPWARYKKEKSAWETEIEEYMKSTPPKQPLEKWKTNKRYEHKIPTEIIASLNLENQEESPLSSATRKLSKSFQKLLPSEKSSRQKISAKSSKIGFKFTNSTSDSIEASQDTRRSIPEPFMRHQPILRPPFQSTTYLKPPSSASERSNRSKCPSVDSGSSNSSEMVQYPPESDDAMSFWERKDLELFMKHIIMDIVSDILLRERERHRKRLMWALKPQSKPGDRGERSTDKCLAILEQLFESIPTREEYCEDDPAKVWNLKEFAQDKYEVLKYWGNRIFTLDFEEKDMY